MCVRARGKAWDHTRADKKERVLPEYSWDYCFPGDEMGYKWTVLVGRERRTKAWMATTIPSKGGMGRFAVDKRVEFIGECGDGERDVIVKSDQENSAHYLVREVVEQRLENKTLVEEAPMKSSGSNGVVERAVQEVEGAVRAVFLVLQERLCRKVDARARVVAFLPEYMAYIMNRLKVGEDGKTVYERVRGKRASVVGLEFGEKVLFKIHAGSKLQKINPR